MKTFAVPLLLLLSACVTTPPPPPRPDWIAHPKDSDSVYLYRLGSSEKCSSEAAAREAAFQDARAKVAEDVLSASGDPALAKRLRRALPLREVTVIPDACHVEKNRDGFACWVQASYPLAERQRLLDRIALSGRVEGLWAEAQAAAQADRFDEAERALQTVLENYDAMLAPTFDRQRVQYLAAELPRARRRKELGGFWADAQTAAHAGRHAEAEQGLRAVLERYDPAIAPPFDREQAQLLHGDMLLALKKDREAARCYLDVKRTSAKTGYQTEAARKYEAIPKSRFWEMFDRWGGRRVALLCAIREGKGLRRFAPLTEVLMKECGLAGMETTDIAMELTPEEMAPVFERQAFSGVVLKTGGAAGILWAILVDIDPARRGKTEDVLGVSASVLDTDVRFFIVAGESGKLVYNGSFKETAGASSESKLAERAAAVMIVKYLLPQCPAVEKQKME
ncbi:MAG: hypothetical protein HY343_05165 [Lentisphaerae bacterium]|nr:hypothetical protein [Lentisphaerota bacterium]